MKGARGKDSHSEDRGTMDDRCARTRDEKNGWRKGLGSVRRSWFGVQQKKGVIHPGRSTLTY